MNLKIDIRVPVGGTIVETAEFAATCEMAGFDGVGIIDHQHTGRDVFMAMALTAIRTRKLHIYPAVTNPFTRHPMVLASLAHSLQEIAPGRIALCIGAGFMSARHINRQPASLAEMRRTVVDIRNLLAGKDVYPGMTEGRLVGRAENSTPVQVCATGPRMIELAGEVGDGAMLMTGIHPAMVAEACSHLRAGAERAARSIKTLPITLVAAGVLASDRGSALEAARPHCWSQMNHPINGERMRRAGIDWPEGLEGPGDIPGDVLARVCDATGLFGSAENWADGIRAVSSLPNVDRLFIQPNLTYDFPETTISRFRDEVKPLL